MFAPEHEWRANLENIILASSATDNEPALAESIYGACDAVLRPSFNANEEASAASAQVQLFEPA